MSREFYGATIEAEASVNQLLGIPATGSEQDWEFELADPKRIDAMLLALLSDGLDFETKSALALLTISSMGEASEIGALQPLDVVRLSGILTSDQGLRDRMQFYWVELGRSDNPDILGAILSS